MADVALTPEAIEDILEIYGYILERDGEEQAESIPGRLEGRVRGLGTFGLRGKFPEELVPFGNRNIREVQEAPWRIFYRPEGGKVFVPGVLDGRRAVRELLEHRLL
ncbi:type II toxin-antitoxin system RelE/ParE family toxin [Nitratidesulfovibrio sp. 1201_IL3209]|uniref:type II toxin-antitoxin system RelE/ParE family toxin n=1 Tax=Nitratidesulfovibrio sp. 1201_IL3209 TaxID=3084053 RepID=UPI002FD9062D